MDAWRRANFGASANDSAIAGDAADPDGDGFTNADEFTAGTNPLDSQSVPDRESGYSSPTRPSSRRLFWQADLLAKSFQSRIAAKQSQFREAEYRAHPNRPHYGHAIQSLQCAFLIAQTREDHGLLERPAKDQLPAFQPLRGDRTAHKRSPDRPDWTCRHS